MSIKDVKEYFEFESGAQFRKEWNELEQKDKEELKELCAEEMKK